MALLNTKARQHIQAYMRQMFAEYEHGYPTFIDTASAILPSKTMDERFPFVVRSLWLSWSCTPPDDWQDQLPNLYASFVSDFDWTADGAPEWVNKGLIHRTLSVWQKRYPIPMTTRQALAMILHAGQLHDVLKGAA